MHYVGCHTSAEPSVAEEKDAEDVAEEEASRGNMAELEQVMAEQQSRRTELNDYIDNLKVEHFCSHHVLFHHAACRA